MVTCEVCGGHVESRDDGSAGIVIEYYNLIPEYTECYGFCVEHVPNEEELYAVKRRIKRGLDPLLD